MISSSLWRGNRRSDHWLQRAKCSPCPFELTKKIAQILTPCSRKAFISFSLEQSVDENISIFKYSLFSKDKWDSLLFFLPVQFFISLYACIYVIKSKLVSVVYIVSSCFVLLSLHAYYCLPVCWVSFLGSGCSFFDHSPFR